MPKLQQETLLHRQAFEYYLALGKERSIGKVADKFKFSYVAVKNWRSSFQWEKKVIEREAKLIDKLEGIAEKKTLTAIERQLKIVGAIQARFVEQVKNGKLKPTVLEFIRCAEHELLLMGHPTKREAHTLDLGALGEAIANIIAVINRCLPQSCPGCGLHLDARQQIAQGLQMALPAPQEPVIAAETAEAIEPQEPQQPPA